MIALRGKVRRTNPSGSPRSSPVAIATPPITTDASGNPQIVKPPPGAWTWTGLWAFDAVPDPPEGEDDPALVPPHRRPRPVPGSAGATASTGSGTGSASGSAHPRGFVYKFQEVVDPSTIRVPSLNDDEDERREEERRVEAERKAKARAEASARARAKAKAVAAAAPSKRRKGMCKIAHCPKTRQGNCQGMCRAHFQESLLREEETKEKEAESEAGNAKVDLDTVDTAAAATCSAAAPAVGEANAEDAKPADGDKEPSAAQENKAEEGTTAVVEGPGSTKDAKTYDDKSTLTAVRPVPGAAAPAGAAATPESTAPAPAAAISMSKDKPKTTEESRCDATDGEPNESSIKNSKEDKAPATPATPGSKEAITFATPSDDGKPYTDASLTYPGQCPPSGRWTGYFENETRRKDRQTSRVPEVFYLFFNTTPAGDATTIFTDVTIEGEEGADEEEEKEGSEKEGEGEKKSNVQVVDLEKKEKEDSGTKDEEMATTTSTSAAAAAAASRDSSNLNTALPAKSTADGSEKKDDAEAKNTEAVTATQKTGKAKEGHLPSGHIHVRGCGTNQYGTWELVGGYDPVLGVLRCQRIYVNLASDEKNDKSRSSSQTSTPNRSRSRSRGTSFGEGSAVRTSSRKRQISWRKASAYEAEADKKAAAGSAKKRPRAMSEGAGKAAASAAPSAAGGRGLGAAGLSVSAAKAAAAAQAAMGVGPAGILSPRGTAPGGKSQHIHRKPSTPRAAGPKKAAKGVPSAVAPPVATIMLPPAGDPKKAKWKAAHYFMYETMYDGEGSTKVSPNSVTGRPSSPTGSIGTANSSPGGGPHAQFVVYEGELNNGLREGRGVCLYSNDLLYEGEWRRNKEHGKGILLTSDRSRVIYEGDWERGRMHGQGTYYYPTDSPFVDLVTGAPTPVDSEKTTKDPRESKGGVYTGDFKENARHGVGMYTLPDGSVYDGDWRENVPCGRGTFRWIDGSVYTGQWKNGKRHGQGVLNASDGFSYDGMWVNNAMEGRGVAIYPKGQKYEGAWVGGKREGRGTILFTNGAVYEGRFRDDLMEGQGTLKMTRNAVVPKIEHGDEEDDEDTRKQKDGDGDVVMNDAASEKAEEKEKEDWMIPIQFQSDISSIHQKAGFTEGGE